MNQKHCRGCPHLDFNAMTDEMYCKLKDFELIRLRWHKQRPDWCPLVTGGQKGEPMTKGEALKKMQAVKAYMTSGNPIWDVTEIGEAFGMAIEALEQPEQQWIPCSERLPERTGYYLVTGRQGAVNKRLYQDGYWYGNWTVIAWMPLPDPWEGENNGI